MIDDNDDARKKYKKDLDRLKPDLEAYTRQKEAALGLVPGALSKAGSYATYFHYPLDCIFTNPLL